MQLILNILLICITIFICLIVLTAAVHIFLGAPYVPTPMSIVRTMIDLADIKSNEVVYDLGAGDARLLIEAKKAEPSITAVGFEIAPLVWILGKLRIVFSGQSVSLRMRSLLGADVSKADVVFLYLSPAVMHALREKFATELRPGTRIVSHGFVLPDREPLQIQRVHVPLWGSKNVYLYIW